MKRYLLYLKILITENVSFFFLWTLVCDITVRKSVAIETSRDKKENWPMRAEDFYFLFFVFLVQCERFPPDRPNDGEKDVKIIQHWMNSSILMNGQNISYKPQTNKQTNTNTNTNTNKHKHRTKPETQTLSFVEERKIHISELFVLQSLNTVTVCVCAWVCAWVCVCERVCCFTVSC